MKRILLMILCLAPASAFAQPKPKPEACDFSIQCKAPNSNFSVSFKSRSKDCTEDDQEAFLETGGKSAKLNLPAAWYLDTTNVGNLAATCKAGDDEYPLFPAGGSQYLLVLRSSDRPNLDKVSVALLDVAQSKVLDVQTLGASEKLSTGVLSDGKIFKIQLVKDNLKEMRCDCDAAFVEGWMEFQALNGKIEKHWAR